MSSAAGFRDLEATAIQRVLTTATLGRTLHVLDSTSSTNTLAVSLAQQDAPHGTVVVAESQTAGRGRLGRHWYSPPGKNLYCSVLLRVPVSRDRVGAWLSWTPLIAPLAAAQAVRAVARLASSVKWPNDVLVGNRKVGGVLCESGDLHAAAPYVVVGLGLNVNIEAGEFPEELREIATSLAMEAGQSFDRAVLLAAFLSELEVRCDAFLAGRDADLHREYEQRCSTVGRRVQVELAHGERVEGLAESIQRDGALRVVRDGRLPVDIRTGDVVHLR